MAVGDRVVDQGIEFVVVFDGRQELLSDYPRASTLAPMAMDPIDQHRNKGGRGRRLTASMRRARLDLQELSAQSDTDGLPPGGDGSRVRRRAEHVSGEQTT